MQSSRNFKWVIHEVPYIPSQISMADMHTNGNLVSDAEFAQIKAKIATKEDSVKSDRRYRKTELGDAKESKNKHGIIHLAKENKYIAIHKGLKHEPKKEAEYYTYLLGRGTYGVVKIGQDQNGKFYAIKISNEINEKEYVYLQQSGMAVAKIQRESPTKGLQENIVMEIAPGMDLFNFVKTYSKKVSIKAIRFIEIAIKILESIENLHSKQILHRDIKLENFVFDPVSEKLTLIDFGLAVTLSKGDLFIGNGVVGNSDLLAPEIVQDLHYSKKSEIYALGMTLGDLFKMVDYSYLRKQDHVVKNPVKILPQKGCYFESNNVIPNEKMRLVILKFLQKMISHDLDQRPDISTCIDFFKNIKKELLETNYIDIGIVNINDWMASEKNAKARTELIEKLKQFDKIWFIDTRDQFYPFEYMQLRKEFEANHIQLGDKIFFLPAGNENEMYREIDLYSKNTYPEKKYRLSYVGNKTGIYKEDLCFFSKSTEISENKIHNEVNHCKI